MEVVGTQYPNLIDILNRMDPDGKQAKVAEVLVSMNEVLDDMYFVEGNLPDGHKSTVRISQSGGTWRKLYGGVPSSKNGVAQVTDTTGMLEKVCEVDAAVIDMAGGSAEFRFQEETADLAALNDQIADAFFYANSRLEPEKPTGIAPRFPGLSTANVINAGGSGSTCSSIWVVTWGPQTFHMIYPKGSKAGLSMEDFGKQLIPAPDGNGSYAAYRTHYKWALGMCLRDWRSVVRIANVPAAASAATIEEYLIAALNKNKCKNLGRTVIYCNETVKTALDIRALNKSNAIYTADEIFGRPVNKFRGYPIRQCDALLQTETALV